MTWQGKRRSQLPRNWASLRKQRLELDGYRCTAPVADMYRDARGTVVRDFARCPRRATEVDHHLDPHDHRLEALRSLCAAHSGQR